MKTASKVVLVLLISTVALVASQEESRAYVSNHLCSLLDCLFGE